MNGKKITIEDLFEAKGSGKKITAVSCYDAMTARLVNQTDIDMILVGDSAAQLILGFDTTLPATMEFMTAITAAVRRGAPDKFLVADMPFLSYQCGINEAVANAGRFIVEASAQMVKIEAAAAQLDVIKAVSQADIAVMAHIGIRPQSISKGKLRAKARDTEMAVELISLAEDMIEAGACSILIEGAAAEAAGIITENSSVPVIGCGSGADCDGQILVAPDILGLTRMPPRFVKKYTDLAPEIMKAFILYSKEVREGRFPDGSHSYHMKPGEYERLKDVIGLTGPDDL